MTRKFGELGFTIVMAFIILMSLASMQGSACAGALFTLFSGCS